MSAELTIGQVGRTRARYGFLGYSNTAGEKAQASISWTPAGTAVEFIAYAADIDWTSATVDTVVDCDNGTARFIVNTTGTLVVQFIGAAGTSTYTSSTTLTLTDGNAAWIRATVNLSTNKANFYTSTDPLWTDFGSVSWSAFGTADIAAATVPTTINACTTMAIGSTTASGAPFNGRIYKWRVTNSGTVISRMDVGNATQGASTITDEQSNSFTVTTVGVTTEGDLDDTFQIAPNPDISWDGDRLTFSGDLIATDTNEARALRRQFAGYKGNTDEPIIPVKWAPDPDLTAFYYFIDGEVGTIPASYINGKGWFPFTVDLAAVPDKYSPQFEVLVDGTNRSNSVSMAGNAWVGLPVKEDYNDTTKSGYADITATSSLTAYTNGSVTLDKFNSFPAAIPFSPTVDNYYNGAVRIETSSDGANWRPVIGRQIPDQDWRITNDYTRVTGRAGLQLRAEVWDPSSVQWEPTDFQVGFYSTTFTNGGGGWSNPSVNVNRPEVGSLKLAWTNGQATVDLTLRRGSPVIEGYTLAPASTSNMSVSRTAAEAATAITNGILATSANTNGNRFVMVSSLAQGVTQVTTNTTGIYTGGIGRFNWGLSVVTGTAPFTATNNYWVAVEHFQQPVGK